MSERQRMYVLIAHGEHRYLFYFRRSQEASVRLAAARMLLDEELNFDMADLEAVDRELKEMRS
jgi:hypothetical protein